MAAARLRQAAAPLASSLAASGAALPTSRAARVAGKTLAAGAAGVAAYKATEYGLGETVPYGADGGRRRGPEPLWAVLLGAARMGFPMRLGPAEACDLTELGYSEAERQLGPEGLTPLPAWQIKVHWIRPEGPLRAGVEEVYTTPYQQAVEASMHAVVAALLQEAREKGFGKQVLEHGFHLIVIPRDCPLAESLPSDAVLLPAGLIEDCVAFTRKPNKEPDLPAAMAGLKFMLAHELAHVYLRHGDERVQWLAAAEGFRAYVRTVEWARSLPVVGAAAAQLMPAPTSEEERTEGYQQFATEMQQLYWRHEFEADEVACALLARLRVPPDQWAVGFRVLANSVLWHGHQALRELQHRQQQLGPDEKRQAAAADGFPGADFDAGVALIQAALATGDIDTLERLMLQLQARAAWHKLRALADQSSSGGTNAGEGGQSTGEGGQSAGNKDAVLVGKFSLGPAVVEGPQACPEPAVHAFLTDVATTHPRVAPRLARIAHLSGQLPMLLRATAPPVAVGGRYSNASVAEQVAEQLAAGLVADAAAKEAAAKAAEAAAEEAAGNAAEVAALAGAVAAGVAAAAAAAANAAADSRPG